MSMPIPNGTYAIRARRGGIPNISAFNFTNVSFTLQHRHSFKV